MKKIKLDIPQTKVKKSQQQQKIQRYQAIKQKEQTQLKRQDNYMK